MHSSPQWDHGSKAEPLYGHYVYSISRFFHTHTHTHNKYETQETGDPAGMKCQHGFSQLQAVSHGKSLLLCGGILGI